MRKLRLGNSVMCLNQSSSLGSESRALVLEFSAHPPLSRVGQCKGTDNKYSGLCKPNAVSVPTPQLCHCSVRATGMNESVGVAMS